METTREERRGYEIIETAEGTKAIRCHRCGRVSHHPEDVTRKYCGFCHMYHGDMDLSENFENSDERP